MYVDKKNMFIYKVNKYVGKQMVLYCITVLMMSTVQKNDSSMQYSFYNIRIKK